MAMRIALPGTGSIAIRHPQSGPVGAAKEPSTVKASSLSAAPVHVITLRPMCHVSTQCALVVAAFGSIPSRNEPSWGASW